MEKSVFEYKALTLLYPDWRKLPCMYEDSLSNAVMITSQQPFKININPVYATRPWPMHWHDAFEINYVLKGTGLFVIENQEFSFQPNQVHVINGVSRHMLYAREDGLIFNVHFHPSLLYDASFRALQHVAEQPFSSTMQHFRSVLPNDHPHTAEIIDLLRRIEVEHNCEANGWQLIVKGLVLHIVGLLVRHFLSPELPDHATIARKELLMRLAPALRLIELHIEEPPSLEELASAVTLSQSHFSALFREATGSSPVAYRNARRIALAQQLLVSTDQSIASIADKVGFSTLQQFNLIFHRIVGTTPRVYRQGDFNTDQP
jgi:AraC-like DNA-binding protein/mannose-6-phosphate isomerase-like protein (cupin superfamily)